MVGLREEPCGFLLSEQLVVYPEKTAPSPACDSAVHFILTESVPHPMQLPLALQGRLALPAQSCQRLEY